MDNGEPLRVQPVACRTGFFDCSRQPLLGERYPSGEEACSAAPVDVLTHKVLDGIIPGPIRLSTARNSR